MIVLRILYWLTKIGAPLTLVLFPAIVIYGTFNTWNPAIEVLKTYKSQTPILVGFAESGKHSWSDGKWRDYSYSKRIYIIVPSVLSKPKTISITQYADKSLQVTENEYGFLYLALWYLFCMLATWGLWFRSNKLS